ncbi:MAG: transporter, partial [Muribaculaceae bacterium]|nr:transporter [Muribaculaceae bacterium]
MIFAKIAVVIALPFVVVLCLQRFMPAGNAKIAVYMQFSFYLWAFALFVTIGQTIDFVADKWGENLANVMWLGAISLTICISQFCLGKAIGRRYGDRIAGGQMLAQKNSAMGIW